jgi:hypothetical protein
MQEQDLRGICEAPLAKPNPMSGFICADVSSVDSVSAGSIQSRS